MNKIILLILITHLALGLQLHAQQSLQVSGKVTDANTKEAFIGVTVVVKGTTIGTVTDFNGNYILKIPEKEGQILKFSFMGYKEKEEKIAGRKIIDVEMEEETQLLSDVVVVGYGVQKKESVVGSISTIDNKTLVSSPVTNISQAMAGKLSGVQVVQSSGEVGDDVADVYVRGLATWNDGSPIFVVDGIVRTEYAKIDPNEIASINILKVASATAVYGVKGANGVIIVTTKRGTLGKPKISITVQNAITQPVNIPQPLAAYDAMALRYLADWGQYNKRTPKTGSTASDLALWRTGASPWTHPDVDWMDAVMKKHSSQQQYNMNVSGGTEAIKYFVSGGYLNQNGFYKNDDLTKYSRFNFRSNLDAEISKNLSASLSIGARVERLNSPNSTIWGSWDIYRAAFANSGRTHPIYNPDGSYSGNGDNIVKKLNEAAIYKNVKSTLESSLSLNQKLNFITEGLSAKAQISFDTQGEVGRSWNSATSEYMYDMATDTYQKYGEDRPLSYDGVKKNYNWYKVYGEAGLNYNRSFGRHSITGLFLANRNELINNGDVVFADQGLVGRATYDLDKKYFAEVNVGYNGSENFPKKSRYGFFPAFAVGWLLSDEPFMEVLSPVVSKFKVRASLGWVGNDKFNKNNDPNTPERFLYLQEHNHAGGYTFGTGDNYYGGIQQGDIANTDVSWEVARKQNIGIETAFFNGLFSLTFDYFYEYRNKILTDIENVKPDYVGAVFKPANIGETQNQGVELELSHTKKISGSFSYYMNGNFTYNKNKILKRADRLGVLPYQKEEGYSIGTPNMWNCIGYFTSYEEIQNSPSQIGVNNGFPGNGEVVPGDLKFEDFNHDGVINQADAYRQGYGTIPEIQYGVTIGANWKAFDFSMLVQGSTHAMFMKHWEIMWAFSNNDNVFEKHNNYWAPEIADQAEFTRFYGKTWINNERYYSTYEAGSGTYVRIKTLELGYTLPESFIKRIGMSGARFYLSSNNLYMWSVEKYLDPDNRDIRGGKMPATRAFNLGMNVTF
jgi:TonB-linked SusC/RagA family outer membrane protein